MTAGYIVLILVVFSGCSEGERGIFATIAIEEEIKKGNLVENASISGLVKGTFDNDDRYIVVAGTKVFGRFEPGNDWSEIKAPGSRLAQYITGRYSTAGTANLGGDEPAAAVNEVYVVYQSGSSADNAIFRLNDNLGWDLVYTPSDTYIDGMIGIDDVVFVSTRNGGLFAWDTAVSETPDYSIAGFNDGLRDGVRVDATGDFFLVGKSAFLARLDSGFSNLEEFSTTDNSPQPRGIGYSDFDGGILAVTDMSGAVYIADADDDPQSGAAKWNNAGSPGRLASDIVWVSNLNGGTGAFLVSTASDAIRNERGRGYFEAAISGTVGDYSLSLTNEVGNNYEASDLAIASINHFRHYGNGVVFALTSGRGLWSTVYPDSANPTWRWE